MNTQPQWKFGGSVPESYERHLVPSIFGPWAHDFVEMAALRAGERVLDIERRLDLLPVFEHCRHHIERPKHADGAVVDGEDRPAPAAA